GPLHAGSLVAALASWLDVRARGPQAQWLVRIEDADTERCLPGVGETMLSQLAACGLVPDAPPVWQTERDSLYQAALDRLQTDGLCYPCGCSRKDIGERVYPGTCRNGLNGKAARAWRFATGKFETNVVRWTDRRLGAQQQDVATEVGDFVLKRADGPWAYQLAVVVDDATQGISDIVRGEDLADNTARQILLQRALGLPTPSYLHTPLVRAADGQKLSKQTGAEALDTGTPEAALAALRAAAQVLGLPAQHGASITDALAAWVAAWRALYNPRP
ncbi:MAG: tRNA glutamyl-Q(34) synthetase GluQRS, partial [Comamonadaceae bacterium]